MFYIQHNNYVINYYQEADRHKPLPKNRINVSPQTIIVDPKKQIYFLFVTNITKVVNLTLL